MILYALTFLLSFSLSRKMVINYYHIVLAAITFFCLNYYARGFEYEDDMHAYFKTYNENGGFDFLEFGMEILFRIFRFIGIDNIRQFNAALGFFQALILGLIFNGKNRFYWIMYCAILFSAPFIIYNGLFVRQGFSVILMIPILLGIVKSKYANTALASCAILFHNSALFILIIFSIAKYFGRIGRLPGLFLLSFLIFYQPFGQNEFLAIGNLLGYGKFDFWLLNNFNQADRLSITAFFFPLLILGYISQKGWFINGVARVSFVLITLSYMFGTVPFLAVRMGLLPIVYSPLFLYEVTKMNRRNFFFTVITYFAYTWIAFSFTKSDILKINFGGFL